MSYIEDWLRSLEQRNTAPGFMIGGDEPFMGDPGFMIGPPGFPGAGPDPAPMQPPIDLPGAPPGQGFYEQNPVPEFAPSANLEEIFSMSKGPESFRDLGKQDKMQALGDILGSYGQAISGYAANPTMGPGLGEYLGAAGSSIGGIRDKYLGASQQEALEARKEAMARHGMERQMHGDKMEQWRGNAAAADRLAASQAKKATAAAKAEKDAIEAQEKAAGVEAATGMLEHITDEEVRKSFEAMITGGKADKAIDGMTDWLRDRAKAEADRQEELQDAARRQAEEIAKEQRKIAQKVAERAANPNLREFQSGSNVTQINLDTGETVWTRPLTMDEMSVAKFGELVDKEVNQMYRDVVAAEGVPDDEAGVTRLKNRLRAQAENNIRARHSEPTLIDEMKKPPPLTPEDEGLMKQSDAASDAADTLGNVSVTTRENTPKGPPSSLDENELQGIMSVMQQMPGEAGINLLVSQGLTEEEAEWLRSKFGGQ